MLLSCLDLDVCMSILLALGFTQSLLSLVSSHIFV